MKKELIEQNIIVKESIDFSLLLIEYCEILQETKRFIISSQLLRSGTSIGANVMEAQNAESKADFIHKMKIAAKEAEEAQYWLILCHYSKNYSDCTFLFSKLESIQKLLSKILSTSKTNSSK